MIMPPCLPFPPDTYDYLPLVIYVDLDDDDDDGML